MTKQNLIEQFERLKNLIPIDWGGYQISAKENPDSLNFNFNSTPEQEYGHLLWMIDVCIFELKTTENISNIEKYHRWLGFIQGVLVVFGETTIQEERDATRGKI